MEKFTKFAESLTTVVLCLAFAACICMTVHWGWFDRSDPVEPVSVTPAPERVTSVEPKQFEPVAETVTLNAQVIEVVEPEPVVIESEPVEVVEPLYTERELEILAMIVYQEAGSDLCSDSVRQMVGEVVLNRVADPRFPGSIEEVALQQAQYGRLHWTGIQWPARATNPGELHAVDRAYKVAQDLLDGTATKLLPPDTVWQAEFVQGVEVVAQTDGFYFCR